MTGTLTRWFREFTAALYGRVGSGWPLVARLVHLGLAVAVSSVVAANHHGAPLWGFTVVVAVAGVITVLDATGLWSTATLAVVLVQYVFGFVNARAPAPGPVVLYVLIACLYLMHATAALAAALPPTARVEAAVLLRWLSRTVLVLVIAVPFAALPSLTAPGSHEVWMAVGLVAVTVLVLLPLLAFRRRREQPTEDAGS